MSRICRACGGVLGRDCFNEQDCLAISERQAQYDREDNRQNQDEVERLINEINHINQVEIPFMTSKINEAVNIISKLLQDNKDRRVIEVAKEFIDMHTLKEIADEFTQDDDLPF